MRGTSVVVSSSISGFQVQLSRVNSELSNSFKQFQSIVRRDIKELGIQVFLDHQSAHGIAVGTTPNKSLQRI